ncbi:MAG: fatty acid desaturase [Chloroflexi bacterium]|nr:fatty acid desaturase [Chloroflexota bacterium]
MSVAKSTKEKPSWVKIVKTYQSPDLRISIWQMVSSFVPFFILLTLSYFSIGISPLLTIPMGMLASLFVMRIFIIQHDCGHASFFKSQKWNNYVGIFCSIFTLTPYEFWRKSHAIHHAHNGDLNWRGIGDVYTMTVEEYEEASWWSKLKYRIYRNPYIMFTIGAPFQFLFTHRAIFSIWTARSDRGRWSLIRTDLVLLAVFVLAYFTIGIDKVLIVYGPVIIFSSIVGVWLFFVQHQYEDAYWSVVPDWDYKEAALKGSSFMNMNPVFHFFSGYIGYHHIHHLSPKIPNYKLAKCHYENPDFQDVPTMNLYDSACVVFSQLSLWDKKTERLINFKELRRRRAEERKLTTNKVLAS